MSEIINTKTEKNDKSCDQCGTCCRKGGPAIHDKDLYLFTEGVLRLQDLMTFRPGEFVRDESVGKLVPLELDVVKIAPPVNNEAFDWTCRFLITKYNKTSCALHGKHPAECRALFCKNPEPLLALPADGRQSRKQLIEHTKSPSWWLELITSHNEQCDLNNIAEFITKIETEADAKEKLLESIAFDNSFRELVLEKTDITSDLLPFLFGRPLLALMPQFHIDILQTPSGLLLKKQNQKG